MSGSQTDDMAPQLFECFIDRTAADLPDFFPKEAKGAIVAGPDLIRGLKDYSGSCESWGWEADVEGAAFRRGYADGKLNVERHGGFWYIYRNSALEHTVHALVVAFENVPICTRTFRDSIRLVEHCHPEIRAPMAGCWLDVSR